MGCTFSSSSDVSARTFDAIVVPNERSSLLGVAFRQRAAETIGKHIRGWLWRRRLRLRHVSASGVQRMWRGKVGRDKAIRAYAERLANSASVLRRQRTGAILRVNEYTMKKRLGAGAFGTVYVARDGRDQMDVAIKVMSRSVLRRRRVARTQTAYDGVLREIAVMKSLNHPNVVRLLEAIDDPDEDAIFLVMELGGSDLSVPIKARRHTPEAQVSQGGAQAARAPSAESTDYH